MPAKFRSQTPPTGGWINKIILDRIDDLRVQRHNSSGVPVIIGGGGGVTGSGRAGYMAQWVSPSTIGVPSNVLGESPIMVFPGNPPSSIFNGNLIIMGGHEAFSSLGLSPPAIVINGGQTYARQLIADGPVEMFAMDDQGNETQLTGVSAGGVSGNRPLGWSYGSGLAPGISINGQSYPDTYAALVGNAIGLTESNVKTRLPSGTAQKLSVRVLANYFTSTTIVQFRKNGTATALLVNIPAGQTGMFSDTSHTVSVIDGDMGDFLISCPSQNNSITISIIECYV